MNGITKLEAYLWATPNSRRISILFEELGLDYTVHPINIRAMEQFSPEILSLNPYGKLPIVTWQERGESHVMFESGAILLRFGRMNSDLLPAAGPRCDAVLVWFMMAMTSLGPMTGNAHHWTQLAPERNHIAIDHHVALVKRAYAMVERRLAENEYFAGRYSLADIAAYPWIAVHDWAEIDLADYPAVRDWLSRMDERPAVARGMLMPKGARLE